MAEKNTKVEDTTLENQEKTSTNEKKKRMSGPIKRTVAGSVLGATVGYLATPENGKKLLDSIDQEKLKSKSLDFGKAAKEKSRSAVTTLKTSTAGLFKRDKNRDDDAAENDTTLSLDQTEDQETNSDKDYESLKQENEQLNDRLQKLEDMLTKLTEKDEDTDDEDEEDEEETKSKKSTKKASKKKADEDDEDESDDEDDDSEDEQDEEDDDEEDNKGENKKGKSSSSKGKKRSTRKSSSKSKKSSKKEDEGEEEETTLSSDDDTSS